MDDLVIWLRAQLDEDERVAGAADPGPWEVGPKFGALNNRVYVRQEGDLIDSIGTCVIAGQVSNMPRFRGNAHHIAVHNPARVLAEVEAKRRLVDLLVAYLEGDYAPWNEDALHLLALPYADRPGYRDEWRPS